MSKRFLSAITIACSIVGCSTVEHKVVVERYDNLYYKRSGVMPVPNYVHKPAQPPVEDKWINHDKIQTKSLDYTPFTATSKRAPPEVSNESERSLQESNSDFFGRAPVVSEAAPSEPVLRKQTESISTFKDLEANLLQEYQPQENKTKIPMEPTPKPISNLEEPSSSNIKELKSNSTDSSQGYFLQNTPMNSKQFMWPLQGKIIRRMPEQRKNGFKEGISIEGNEGVTIRAAGSGKVIYAGHGHEKYGSLLIIKHPGGYLTAYAHNSKLLVAKGQEVKIGQAIAEVGRSGKAEGPQLYFSMRKGKEIIDPEADLSNDRGG